MVRLNVYPAKSTFAPAEPIELIAEIEAEAAARATVHLSIFHLATRVARDEYPISLAPGQQAVTLNLELTTIAPRGYGAEIVLTDQAGVVLATASTAFDVLNHWTQAPRYGFLTDFTPGRDNAAGTMRALARFHINALQFYDWMYRHDQLLPPADTYADPLNRPLALGTVRTLIDTAHRHGIAALPYTAIYAASPEFYRTHQAWALFKADGQPLDFAEGFLIYMNPAENSPWSRHLLDQFEAVLQTLNFDGIHIDQYGDPIAARDAAGQIVLLDRAFRAFVDAAAGRVKVVRPDASVIFNCVGNWPIETVAGSQADLMYIEVWKPHTHWHDLWRLISEAQHLSHKPVVLAAYIDPAREHNVRLADAIIFASGGYHIELGEPGGMLADPYFPKYRQMSAGLAKTLSAYYDFAVRYENVLALDTHDATEAWSERVIVTGGSIGEQEAQAAVWPIVRAGDGFAAISLINLRGLASDHWTDPLPGAPTSIGPLVVKLYIDQPVSRMWWASPDGDSSQAIPVSSQIGRDGRGNYLSLSLPGLAWWTLIVLEWEN